MSCVAPFLTMPPRAGDGVCGICRSWRSGDFPVCWNCQSAIERLGVATPVLAVSLYSKPSELREWLTFYKPGRGHVVEAYGDLLRQMINDFLVAYGSAMHEDFGPFDYAIPIPSAGSATGAVSGLFEPSSRLLAPLRPALNFGARATVKAGTQDPSWFTVTGSVEGDRVVVIDDVYASGARAQSAASALRGCGAEVRVIFVVARRMNPEFTTAARRLWRRQVALGYDLSAPPYWR